jgi:hypothetical protein
MFTMLSTPRDAHEGFTIDVLRLSDWWRPQSLRGFIAGMAGWWARLAYCDESNGPDFHGYGAGN